MKTVNRSFPYPVVAPFRDDVDANRFGARLKIVADGGRIYIDVQFEVEHAGLLELVKNGSAAFAIHLEAKNMYYRRLFSELKPENRLELRGTDLQGKIEWVPFIISRKDIGNYCPEGLHEDYGSSVFSVRKNEILAVGDGGSFRADPSYDPLKKLSSIMQVLPNEQVSSGPYEVDYSGNKISILLSHEDHQQYGELRGLSRVEAILCNAIAMPALIGAIGLLKNGHDGNERWGVVLRKRLDDITFGWQESDKEPIKLAQLVLSNPLRRGLSDLMALTSGED